MDTLTPSKAAHQLTKILNLFASAHGQPRFPVDVEALAYETFRIFKWNDPITKVMAAPIPSFEGALMSDDGRKKWLMLYNDQLRSAGRIRFTQAHELGHYVLHRSLRDTFQCSTGDMIDLAADERTIESQADVFASTLLMPLDDFRSQMPAIPTLEALGAAAERYGVSLTAAALRWIKHTDACAMLVVHRDGFIDWTCSSQSARAGGAFIRAGLAPTAIPEGSLAANVDVTQERMGKEIAAKTWFPHAETQLSLREMKVCADQFDFVLTLVVLPRGSKVWKPFPLVDEGGPVADSRERSRIPNLR